MTTNNVTVTNDLNITTGTLDFSGTSLNITMNGNATIGANGRFSKGSGLFRLDQSADSFSDNSSPGPQNLGAVEIA